MAKMYDILNSATKKKIGVDIRHNTILFFFDKTVLAKQSLTEEKVNEREHWIAETYKDNTIISTFAGTKEDVAQKCIAHAIKIKEDIEKAKKYGINKPY